MKLLLTSPAIGPLHSWEGKPYLQNVTQQIETSPQCSHVTLTTRPEDADFILFLEENCWKDRNYALRFLSNEFIQKYPEKCFTANYSDFFLGLLPGVYVCLPKHHEDPARFEAGYYLLGGPNPKVPAYVERSATFPREWLFSFRGSDTHPVRRKLFNTATAWREFSSIVETGSFYNNTADEQNLFCEEILKSEFALCPRGIGCSSHRLFEALQLGRAPVIVSDEWTAPTGPNWDEFSIRLPEARVSEMPDLLKRMQPRAREMGLAARATWETWFSPGARVARTLESIQRIQQCRGNQTPNFSKLWKSWAFWSGYGMAPHQRIWKKVAKIWKGKVGA